MAYFALGSLVPTILLLLSLWISSKDKKLMMESHQQQMTLAQQRENSHILERERLLNRLMTRTWQDYQQISGSMQVQDNSPPVGLSDEEELRRSGIQLEDALGTGDEREYYSAEPTIGTDN